MDGRRLKQAALSLIISTLILAPEVIGFELLIPNPQPFRGDEIDGPAFELDKYGFLQRFSYLPEDSWTQGWDTGLIATTGSISSNEFYSLANFANRWQLSKHFEFEFRSERGENFDNRYSYSQLGFGYRLAPDWTLAVLAEWQAEKKEDDVQFELRYRNKDGNRIRFAVVAVDAVFNKKEEAAREYTESPYTYFLEASWQLSESTHLDGYINYNSPLTFEDNRIDLDPLEAQKFEYDNLSARINWRYLSPQKHQWQVSLSTEQGDRKKQRLLSNGELKRDYHAITVRFEQKAPTKIQYWLGIHGIAFDEDNIFFTDEAINQRWQRREYILFGGFHYTMASGTTFSPALFIDKLDNQRVNFESDLSDIDWDDTLVKLNLPFQFHLDQGAELIFNTTFELDRNHFGGFNFQIKIPFG